MGAYFDYRDGDQVTRTYVEMDPESPDGGVKDVYATTFDSPLAKDKNGDPATDEGPPIPTSRSPARKRHRERRKVNGARKKYRLRSARRKP